MNLPRIGDLAISYNDAIPGKEAEQELAKMLYDHNQEMKELMRQLENQNVVGQALGKLTGNKATNIQTEDEQYLAIVERYEQKAKEIASRYLTDPETLNAIGAKWRDKYDFREKEPKTEREEFIARIKTAQPSKDQDQEKG